MTYHYIYTGDADLPFGIGTISVLNCAFQFDYNGKCPQFQETQYGLIKYKLKRDCMIE